MGHHVGSPPLALADVQWTDAEGLTWEAEILSDSDAAAALRGGRLTGFSFGMLPDPAPSITRRLLGDVVHQELGEATIREISLLGPSTAVYGDARVEVVDDA